MRGCNLPRGADMHTLSERTYYLAAFAVLVLLYALTGVSNRIESVDGYLYAGAAEFLNFADVHDPRSLLFHKLNQILAAANAAVGMPFDTYALLCVPTILAGACGVILMHRFLRRHLVLGPEASVVGAALLAVSYGYWRYANELEVYIPSIALILWVLCLLCKSLSEEPPRTKDFAAPGIIAGLAVLYYQANALPLFVAMPILFIWSRRPLAFIPYAAIGCAVIVGGLLIAYAADRTGDVSIQGFLSFLSRRSEEFPAPEIGLVSLARAASAILRDIISFNWLYGSQFGKDLIENSAKAHAYYHDGYFFAASQAPWLVRAAPVTFVATLIGLGALAVSGLLSAVKSAGIKRPVVPFLFAWILIYACVVISLDPTEMEVWIVALVPIWTLFSLLIDKSTLLHQRPITATAIVLLLAFHNFFGGLQIFSSPQSDLYRQQVAGILHEAQKGDFVLFTGPYPPIVKPVRLLTETFENRDRRATDAGQFVTPVYSDGETAMVYRFDEHMIKKMPIDVMLSEIRASGRRLIVPEETLRPRPLPQKLGGQQHFDKLVALGERLGVSAQRIQDGPLGGTYIVTP